MQTLLAEKDSQIAEMDAASSGEAARLGAALEEAKGELIQLKDKHVIFQEFFFLLFLYSKDGISSK